MFINIVNAELIAPSTPHRPLNITQRINHKGEINRARYMPQNPDLIATKTTSGEVWVFDRTKHGNNPDKEGVYKPNIVLSGQDSEGSVTRTYELITGDEFSIVLA
jgi:histone-binding protein RBBP4